MKAYLKKKNIEISLQRYGIDALNAMALGLFGSLIVGLILKNLGEWLSLPILVDIGTFAQSMMGAAIGGAVAYQLKAPILVIVSNVVIGSFAAQLGGPVGCFITVLITTEMGKLVSKTTPADIILTPIICLVLGALIAKGIGAPIQSLMMQISAFIEWSVQLRPFLMGIVLAVSMGVLLTLPISSAAIAIALSLSGIAAGASTVGCCAQMVGFAVMSMRDNNAGAVISLGIGTSMLQLSNIIKNPKIWIPPILTSALLGPLATMYFQMQNIPEGAGMGTSGLVGQIGTISAMGNSQEVYIAMILLHFVLPAILCYAIYRILLMVGWIKIGDLKLN
ncbi:PTS sugar transporter subunit IIC [Flavobacteriaceae bacterium Ap0902]|nr:PTS sugar transporter subunit IIC [Flavobacteriaceae bacterium Ap0902]